MSKHSSDKTVLKTKKNQYRYGKTLLQFSHVWLVKMILENIFSKNTSSFKISKMTSLVEEENKCHT